MVTRIDRLARSIGDLQDIVRELKAKGAILKATEQPIDTSSAAGKAFLDMLGVFAEFETNLRRERQMEGIAAAKLRGVYKGRPASIDAAKVAALKAEGLGATEIAKRLKVGRATVYRVLAERWPPSAPAPDALTQALSQNPRFKVLAASYWARPSERKSSPWRRLEGHVEILKARLAVAEAMGGAEDCQAGEGSRRVLDARGRATSSALVRRLMG